MDATDYPLSLNPAYEPMTKRIIYHPEVFVGKILDYDTLEGATIDIPVTVTYKWYESGNEIFVSEFNHRAHIEQVEGFEDEVLDTLLIVALVKEEIEFHWRTENFGSNQRLTFES